MSLYLNEIVSVAGKPGLHKLVGKRSNGLIVESLNGDKKRFPTSLTQKVSFLSDISMFTYDGDKKLEDILKTLHEKVGAGLELVNKKNSGEEIQSFFRTVVEDFDEDQVYNSDIVKLVSWYSLLKDQLDFNQLTEPENDEKVKEAKKSNTKANLKKPVAKNTPKAQNKAKGGVKKSGNLKAG
jgi:dephospho-CoA kinase